MPTNDEPAHESSEVGAGSFSRPGQFAVASLVPLLLSLCIHLSTMLLLVWWMIPGREVSKTTEQVRSGEIVLVAANQQRAENFLEEAADANHAQANHSLQAAAATQSAEALPREESFELPANFKLPATTGLALPGESLLPGVEGGVAANRRLPSGINEAAILAEDARGRGAGEAPIGTPGGLTVFGAQARGRSFVMVIDRSASMGDQGLGAIRAAADELARQLDSLDEKQRVQIVAYHAAPSLLDAHWLPATPQNKERLLKYLRGLPAFGSTNHTAALTTALKLKPEVIFLLTDGDDPGMDPGQLRIVRELARGRTSIHTIHFGRGSESAASDHFMRKLAADNGGGYVYVNADKLP
jgi:hypothetical protein